MKNLWTNYPEVLQELNEVKKILKDNIKSKGKHLEEAMMPMVESGGKMLRPGFLLLSAKFGEYDAKKIHNLAAVIEMLHLATLVHDDIIDDSKLRRGCESIQYKYGKEYAVYIGDFLFCQCLIMLSEYEYKMDNMRSLAKAISKICMSEIRQYNFRYITKMNLRNYLKIISGKTAALFTLSFYLGAQESGCDKKVSRTLGKIGYNIGMAFQIIDDILDYSGNTEELGKNSLVDLKRGYYTLPLIYAMEDSRGDEILDILNSKELDNNDIKKLVEKVKGYKGIEKSKKLANRYTQRAFSYIDKLPNIESKEIINDVVEKLLSRKY